MQSLDDELATAGGEMSSLRGALAKGLAALNAATEWILAHQAGDPRDAAAGAMSYLRLWGTGLWRLVDGQGGRSRRKTDFGCGKRRSGFSCAPKSLPRAFTAGHILPRALALEAATTAGAGTLMAMADESF